jgi:hypothetical protein
VITSAVSFHRRSSVKKRRYILVGEHEVLSSPWKGERPPDPEIEKIVRRMEYKLLRRAGLISTEPRETDS